ncbi:hypothetical protein Golax_024862, partial [Gossypium laxum]|nr:hypothetical protein [Gossypium laxum]
WLHFRLGLQCSWFIWPPFPSLELVLTQQGVLELPSYTTKTMLGMTIVFLFCFTVGVLGWTLHWSCTCCSLPPDNH